MTRLKWFASILGALLLVVAAALFFRAEQASTSSSSGPAPSESQVAPAVRVLTPEAEKFRAAPPLARIKDLYQSESQRVGQVMSPALTRKRLEVLAQELNEAEISWLERQAFDRSAAMDGRFFAVYLLGLSEVSGALPALGRVALSEVPKLKNDRQMAEERILRAQAVEAASQHCKIEGARDLLLDIVSKQTDEFLRDRAHRGLHACATGKSIEEQDREALGKLEQSQ